MKRKKQRRPRLQGSSRELTSYAATNWGVLRAGGHATGGLEIPTMPTDVSTAAGPVRLAVGANGEPRLLLPLARRETPASVDAGNALSVSVSSFSYKGTRLRFLDLVCVREDLEPVFAEVVDEILARIRGGDGCTDAARSTIRDFRALLTGARATDVGIGRLAGLVAELLVLNRLLDRSPSAWRAWRGPEGDRHDFRVGDTSLEVKASLRVGTSGVTINGLDQLEAPTGGTLHLLHMVLEPVTDGILSLASLARSAMSKVPEPAKIETLLTAAGCWDALAEEWNRHKFRRESEQLYEIRTGFPRLTRTMLKDNSVPFGVHDVNYTIDLSVATKFRCDAIAYRDLETRLCP